MKAYWLLLILGISVFSCSNKNEHQFSRLARDKKQSVKIGVETPIDEKLAANEALHFSDSLMNVLERAVIGQYDEGKLNSDCLPSTKADFLNEKMIWSERLIQEVHKLQDESGNQYWGTVEAMDYLTEKTIERIIKLESCLGNWNAYP